MTHGMPSFPTPLPPARHRRRGWIVLALVSVVIAGSAIAWWQSTGDGASAPAEERGAALADSSARAPAGERVRVRVINSTSTRGLARRATFVLRDFGYDVVDFDTDLRRKRTSTVVQVHTGKTEIAERVLRVLGTGALETRADSLRYLDLTVLIGSDWKPPAQPLRP